MSASVGKKRRFWLILGLLILAAALVWAAAELSGQANGLAQDAGNNSADMEMTTLNTIKKPARTKDAAAPPACDWAKERGIKSSIDANDAQYKNLRGPRQERNEQFGQGVVRHPERRDGLGSGIQEIVRRIRGHVGCVQMPDPGRDRSQDR